MIIVRLIGGLGNQLFQYAIGRNLAERNSTLLKLDLSGYEEYKLQRYGLHYFKIWEHIASLEEIATFRKKKTNYFSKLSSKVIRILGYSQYPTSSFYRESTYVKENEASFDPSVLERTGNIYLEGYWQSERYFSGIREILLREYVIKHDPNYLNKQLSEQISKYDSVSLHIRRGDYVSDPITNKIHGICSNDYYESAIQKITQRVPSCHFFIFSDDPIWVRKNFMIAYPFTIIDHNDASGNFEDLRLMSKCKHNIIANSSFSWWGAWLNRNPEKIVIAPGRWFNDPGLDSNSLIPDSWIKVY